MVGCLAMDKLEMTFKDYRARYPEQVMKQKKEIIKRLETMIKEVYRIGFDLEDYHHSNLMVILSPEKLIKDLKRIDFGKASLFSGARREPYDREEDYYISVMKPYLTQKLQLNK
jgi:hypothetical protein